MSQQRVVICMKWGEIYSADYVNVLYNACHKNINGDFIFLCLTDDSNGLDPMIVTRPIPEIGCNRRMTQHGAWPKLSLFSQDLYGITGRGLFIDLDMVICGSLDSFFDPSNPFIAIDTGPDWQPGKTPGGGRAEIGTGIFGFNIGSETQILKKFQANPIEAFKESSIEQVWVQKHVSSINYWPKGWVISFKRWLRQPIGLDLILQPRTPPNGARVVAFHGNPRPISMLNSGLHHWDTLPHMGWGQVKWMKDYWVTNGGKLPGAN